MSTLHDWITIYRVSWGTEYVDFAKYENAMDVFRHKESVTLTLLTPVKSKRLYCFETLEVKWRKRRDQ